MRQVVEALVEARFVSPTVTTLLSVIHAVSGRVSGMEEINEAYDFGGKSLHSHVCTWGVGSKGGSL